MLKEKMREKEISEIPIIALTAYVSDLGIQECFNSGMELVCTYITYIYNLYVDCMYIYMYI